MSVGIAFFQLGKHLIPLDPLERLRCVEGKLIPTATRERRLFSLKSFAVPFYLLQWLLECECDKRIDMEGILMHLSVKLMDDSDMSMPEVKFGCELEKINRLQKNQPL